MDPVEECCFSRLPVRQCVCVCRPSPGAKAVIIDLRLGVAREGGVRGFVSGSRTAHQLGGGGRKGRRAQAVYQESVPQPCCTLVGLKEPLCVGLSRSRSRTFLPGKSTRPARAAGASGFIHSFFLLNRNYFSGVKQPFTCEDLKARLT